MTKQYNISYFYAEAQDSEKLKRISALNGEPIKAIVTQCLRDWLRGHRMQCEKGIIEDSLARGIAPEEWVRIVIKYGAKGLPCYQQEQKLTKTKIPPEMIDGTIVKHQLNYVVLSLVDYAHLQVAIIRDGDSAIGFISRIVKNYLAKNWERFYANEIAEEEKLEWVLHTRKYMLQELSLAS